MRDSIIRRKTTLQKRVDSIFDAASAKCETLLSNAKEKTQPILGEIAKLDELLAVYGKEGDGAASAPADGDGALPAMLKARR